MIRRPPRSTLFLHDALPISVEMACTGRTSRMKLPSSTSIRSPSDRKSTRLNSSHVAISYAVFCLKKKKKFTKLDKHRTAKILKTNKDRPPSEKQYNLTLAQP